MCPVVEDMHYNKFIGFEPCAYDLSDDDIKSLQDILIKVHENLDDLHNWEKSKKNNI